MNELFLGSIEYTIRVKGDVKNRGYNVFSNDHWFVFLIDLHIQAMHLAKIKILPKVKNNVFQSLLSFVAKI